MLCTCATAFLLFLGSCWRPQFAEPPPARRASREVQDGRRGAPVTAGAARVSERRGGGGRGVGARPAGRRTGGGGDLRDGRESSGLTATAKLCLSASLGWCGGRRGSGPGFAARGAAAVGAPAARPAARRCPGRRWHERPLQVQFAWRLPLPRGRAFLLLPRGRWRSPVSTLCDLHEGHPRGSRGWQAKPHFAKAHPIPAVLLMVKAETEVLGSHFSIVPEIVFAGQVLRPLITPTTSRYFSAHWQLISQLSNLRQSKVDCLGFEAWPFLP